MHKTSCPERRLLYTAHQLPEAWVSLEFRPQCQRVDEEADQSFKLPMRPSRNRRAHNNVVLSAPARQHHLERRKSTMNKVAPSPRANSFSDAVSSAGNAKP